MHFRARYYDPQTGEFLSRDPLEYVDGMSQYRGYFAIGLVDPMGMDRTVTQGLSCTKPGVCPCPLAHQGIKVDTWDCIDGTWVKTGSKQYDFGPAIFNVTDGQGNSSTWGGGFYTCCNLLATCVAGFGQVSVDCGAPADDVYTIPSSPCQDTKFHDTVELLGLYNGFAYNCQEWVWWNKDLGMDAPGDDDCECRKLDYTEKPDPPKCHRKRGSGLWY